MNRCSAAGLIFAVMVFAGTGRSQSVVTEIQLKTDPSDARVRPLESIVIQVLAYGRITNQDGEETKIRLREGGATVRLGDKNGGWLSKPFRFQGKEEEEFYKKEGGGLGSIIFGQAQSRFALQDAVLFTASEREGSYEISATLEGKSASIKIRVDRGAPQRRPKERTRFGAEDRSRDPYRGLAEHYAPMIAQETWFQPKSDYLARFDFDNNLKGNDNWENASRGSSQAYVHYAAMETSTHWFLIYNFFHPRDYSDKCIAGTCHENDNEGLILTVVKDGSRFGRLQVMETLAHNNIYSYTADRSIKKNVHRPDGRFELHEGSHPVAFIESGGHGVYGSTGKHSRYSLRNDRFEIGTGVTYVYKGVAERPKHPDSREVGYELLPIYDHWWSRAREQSPSAKTMFDSYYSYQPYGNRPRPAERRISGAFLGRKHGRNKAKPFWGWHDSRTRKKKVLATGQWGLDPAYGVSRNLRMPSPFSLDYTFNPYLGIGRAVTSRVAPGSPAPVRDEVQPYGGAAVSAAGMGTSLVRIRRARNFDPQSKKGRLDLRLTVDGEVDVLLNQDTIRYLVRGGRPPVDNGSEHTQPIPRASFRRFDIEKKDGRGKVTLLERPAASNNYTAKLRVSDPRGGDDRYHVQLNWQWDRLAPAAVRAGPSVAVADPKVTGPEVARAGPSVAVSDPEPPAGIFSRHPGSAGLPGSAPPRAASADARAVPDRRVEETELTSPKNDPSRYGMGPEGALDFRARVDGTVVVRIIGDRVFAENTSGRPLELDRFTFSQPLPRQRLSRVELYKKKGRGEVVLLERPWEGNNYQAVIRISDPSGGAADYRFELEWER